MRYVFERILVAFLFECAVGGTAPPEAFDKFLEGVSGASYDAAANSLVRDADAFEEIRSHILRMYQGVEARTSFVDEDVFDCITIESQPTVKALNLTTIAAPPPPVVEDAISNVTNLDVPASCKQGTIPMKRLSLERLTQFRTLDHFFAKTPYGSDTRGYTGANPRTGSSKHKYAVGSQGVHNKGGSGVLSIQDPPAGSQFSLSQQWYAAPGQTAECGFVHMGRAAMLFIYHTTGNYQPGTGCYNLDCSAFVQTDHSVKLGGAITPYGREAAWGYKLYHGNWWFYFNYKAIGYFPARIYGSGPMSTGATMIEFGGETASSSSSYPPMGTGQWGTSGYGKAAYQKDIKYYSTELHGHTPHLQAIEDKNCYRISFDRTVPSRRRHWGSYFFFGGPGGGNNCGTGDSEDAVIV